MLARIILLLAIVVPLTHASADTWSEIQKRAKNTQTATAQSTAESIVSNGELPPGKKYHLLLIHDGGKLSQYLASMLTQPRAQLIDWVAACNVRLMAQTEPQVLEHHADLVQKHQGQMPILAFIQQTADDGRGAVWCSAAGSQIPQSESDMAAWLNKYYQATVQAATRANPLAVVAGPQNLRQLSFNQVGFNLVGNQSGNSDSYFTPRGGGSAPAPYQPDRRPLFNPQLDIAVPDTLNTRVGLNPETRTTLLCVAFLAIVCCLVLASSPIISAVIIGHALTHDDDGPSPPSLRP